METDNEMKRLIQRTKGNLEERERKHGGMGRKGGRRANRKRARGLPSAGTELGRKSGTARTLRLSEFQASKD